MAELGAKTHCRQIIENNRQIIDSNLDNLAEDYDDSRRYRAATVKSLKKLNKEPLVDKAFKFVKLLFEARMLLAKTPIIILPETLELNETLLQAESIKQPEFDTDKWGDKLLGKLEERLTEKVENILPTVVNDAVVTITSSKKFTKPWVDNFRKSQSEFKGEINKVFKETLTKSLQETQHQTVDAISARQDAEAFEKKKRCGNIVIRGVPESDCEIAATRKKENTDFIAKICVIQPEEIVKVFRAGKRDEKSTFPRPIIATMTSPDLAKRLHKYGNGGRVILDKRVWWINPDLTANERKRHFQCRELRRALLQSGRTFPPTSPISLHND